MLIAHISDLHLLSLRGVRARDFFNKRITGGLNLLFNRGGEFPGRMARALVQALRAARPDHLIVSGDVTNLSFEAELELVREILSQLDLPASEITVVPGNHDYYTRGAARQDHFSSVMAPFLEGDLQPGPGRFPFVRLRDDVAIVALSSARPRPPFIASGTLGDAQLELTEKLLIHEACRERFRLVVLHHPPVSEHIKWHNRLTDAGAFLDLLRRAGADLVVHGHLHRFCQESLQGPDGRIPLLGVGSSTWLSPRDPGRRAQYNLYDIGEGFSFTRQFVEDAP